MFQSTLKNKVYYSSIVSPLPMYSKKSFPTLCVFSIKPGFLRNLSLLSYFFLLCSKIYLDSMISCYWNVSYISVASCVDPISQCNSTITCILMMYSIAGANNLDVVLSDTRPVFSPFDIIRYQFGILLGGYPGKYQTIFYGYSLHLDKNSKFLVNLI